MVGRLLKAMFESSSVNGRWRGFRTVDMGFDREIGGEVSGVVRSSLQAAGTGLAIGTDARTINLPRDEA